MEDEQEVEDFRDTMRALRGTVVHCAECEAAFTRVELTADLKVYRHAPCTRPDSEGRTRVLSVPRKERIHVGCVKLGHCYGCGDAMYQRDERETFDIVNLASTHEIHVSCREKARVRKVREREAMLERDEATTRRALRHVMYADIRERTKRGEHVVVLCRQQERNDIAGVFLRDANSIHSPQRSGKTTVTWTDRGGTLLVMTYNPVCLRGRKGISHIYVTRLLSCKEDLPERWLAGLERDALTSFVPDAKRPYVTVEHE